MHFVHSLPLLEFLNKSKIGIEVSYEGGKGIMGKWGMGVGSRWSVVGGR